MDEKPNKLRGNFVLRQELKNLTVETTPICSIICNIVLTILFIVITVPISKSANSFKSYTSEYTNCTLVKPSSDSLCQVKINIEDDIVGNAYIFYELHDFYINHKDFVRSKDYGALNNKNDNQSTIKCEGANYMYEIKDDKNYTSIGGFQLLNTSNADPCGLFAKYHFTDTFQLLDPSGAKLFINETGIAYPEHKKVLFKNGENWEKNQWINIEDEHFIVWMSPEADNDFIKPWGRVEGELFKKGNYTFLIHNGKY